MRIPCSVKYYNTIPNDPSKRRGKYLKNACYALCYGAGIIRCARESKLGLRRTRVLANQLNYF